VVKREVTKKRKILGKGAQSGTIQQPVASDPKKGTAKKKMATSPSGPNRSARDQGKPLISEGAPKRKIRSPRAAAVIVTPPTTGESTLAQLIAEAKRRIKLEDLGIAYLRPKVAVTGAMFLKIPGENSAARADQLAAKLREALTAMGASVTRPVKREDMRITGLDESITGEEVAAAVVAAGGCETADVKVGSIRKAPSGLGTA